MAAKSIKSMIPPVISQDRQTTHERDDSQQLIRSRSVRASTRRRPRFSVRSSKAPKKSERVRQTKKVFDPFEVQQASIQHDIVPEQPAKKKKRRTPLRVGQDSRTSPLVFSTFDAYTFEAWLIFGCIYKNY